MFFLSFFFLLSSLFVFYVSLAGLFAAPKLLRPRRSIHRVCAPMAKRSTCGTHRETDASTNCEASSQRRCASDAGMAGK